jgi:glycosyltransferase involved in cell wall biosynthesis
MVTPTYYPIKGGMETMINSLSTRLNQKEIHTDIMTFNMIDGITVFKIPGLNWLPIQHSPRITMQVNIIPGRYLNLVEKYDIVHFHGVEFSFPLFSIFVRKPKILHSHGINTDYFKRYRLSRYMLRNVADLYISITRRMKQDFIELGIPPQNVTYLPNGVDTQTFHPEGNKIPNLILFVGRIAPAKGLHVLLRSLDYLIAAVHLVVIGPMCCSDQYKQNILELIKDQNRRHKHEITYLGPQEISEIVKWYQMASVFVSPSLLEAFGLANLEALACETPVIATTVGGIPEVVRNGENGILVPPDNTIKLAEAIQYLLDNEDLIVRLGQNGRQWAIDNFSMEVIVNKTINIYRIMLEKYESQ